MYQICIVDDEDISLNQLKEILLKFFKEKSIQVEIFSFNNPVNFIDKFIPNKYDIIFLDISMPQINGIDVGKKIREKDISTTIIFTTSLIQYALSGYEVNAFDYLLKPINYSSLALTLQRWLKLQNNNDNSITIKYKNSFIKLDIISILYIEVIDHKLIIHTKNEDYSLRDSLDNYIDKLKDYNFSLCNRCYLVNLRYVTKIDDGIAYLGKIGLVISRAKKKAFIEQLNNYLSLGGGL